MLKSYLLDAFKANLSSVKHINQTTWSSYQQMAAFGELTGLIAEISSAIHHAGAYMRSVRKLKSKGLKLVLFKRLVKIIKYMH